MSLLSGWRLPLRLARRDAMRHRGRSILVLAMIALPVLAVTTADVVIHTSEVTGVESLDRRMGAADARVEVQPGVTYIEQGPDPEIGYGSGSDGSDSMPSAQQVAAELGDARLVELRTGATTVRTEHGAGHVETTEVDLGDPITEGLFTLTSGRMPRAPGEVVVNQALLDKGYVVGDPLDVTNDEESTDGLPDPTIVGAAESTAYRNVPLAAGLLGTFDVGTPGGRTWLVDGDQVSWDQVRALNTIGALVTSRAVITDPPPASEVPQNFTTGPNEATVAVLVLIVAMVLLEVVLLAGPAFAVGARRQQRSLALMAAAGGTPKQARRVVLGSAIVLGAAAAVVGVLAGIGLGWILIPVVQRFSDNWLGPFEVPWLQLAGVAAFGLLAAFLAAVVPARIASRQDVVAVLAGRRGDRAPSLRSPLIGLVLLGVGILGAVLGARGRGEFLIAASAIPAVLGMILLIPVVLVILGRLSARLPVVLRYAVRDAARHRTRTVPAVAAVAATVAGAVALGIAVSSDAYKNEATYQATLPEGTGLLTSYGEPQWDVFAGVVADEAPAASVTSVIGVDESGSKQGVSSFVELVSSSDERPLLKGWVASLSTGMLVSDDAISPVVAGVAARERPGAARALAAGRVVAFTDQPVGSREVDVIALVHRFDPADGSETTRSVSVAAHLVPVTGEVGAQGVMPTSVARTLGVGVTTVALLVDGAEISRDEEEAITEGITTISQDTSFYVERGYQADDETVIIQLILVGLGAVLMLGGTLTATFLALSDARPDLATLSAVGAAPRTRRGVASAYAVVIGLVGAALGAAVGFIPGIAVTYPLTGDSYGSVQGMTIATDDPTWASHYLDIPWLMILGLVVALPLLTAAIVWLFARSRLPLVARLD